MTTTGINDYLIHIFYGSQGIVICLADGMLLLTILLERSFRQRREMLIIAGLAGADVIYGLGITLLSIYRVSVISRGEDNDKTTAWDCLTRSPLFFVNFGLQLTALMNVVVSGDRLLAVAWPLKYIKLDRRYAIKVLALVVFYGVTSLAVMLISTYVDTTFSSILSFTKLCSSAPVAPAFDLYQTTLVALAGYISVAIYIGVFFAYRHSIVRNSVPNSETDSNQVALQRRLTITLGIICVSTFFFSILPFSVNAICLWTNICKQKGSIVGTINRFTTIVNVAIYIYRQKEMRTEMWSIIKCKRANRNRIASDTAGFGTQARLNEEPV